MSRSMENLARAVPDMEELRDFIRQHTAWSLSSGELIKLYGKYFNHDSRSLDYDLLMRDLQAGLVSREAVNAFDADSTKKTKRPSSYDQVIGKIRTRLLHRINCLKGEGNLKKAHLLLGESRSSVVRRDQLRTACQSRLSLPLSDAELDELFAQLDPQRQGTISIRQLINAVLKSDAKATEVSLSLGDSSSRPSPGRGASRDSRDSQRASISYAHRVQGLVPPDPKLCRPMSVEDLEHYIWQRVFERASLESNMLKTLTRLFSDGQALTQGEHFVSLDQLRFSLWKGLRAHVSDEDVQAFYRHHARGSEQGIRTFDLIDAIIRREPVTRPLLDDRAHFDKTDRLKLSTSLRRSSAIEAFLIELRRRINDLVNRESRAPHYLLHACVKMTEPQTREFLRRKLRLDIDALPPAIAAEVLAEYRAGDLVDIKRLLLEAMAIRDDSVRRSGDAPTMGLAGQTLLNGGLVTVDRLPAALTLARMGPQEVEEAVRAKCLERIKSGHPHSSLYRLFRESDQETRALSQAGLRRLLNRFDVLVSDEDLSAFFATHDRGDGMMDVHAFLRRILPPADPDANPFTPKDPAVVRQEVNLAMALEVLTGRRKEVSALNGPSGTRVEPQFLQTLQSPLSPRASPFSPPPSAGRDGGGVQVRSSPALFAVAPVLAPASAVVQGVDVEAFDRRVGLAESLLQAMRDLPLLAAEPAAGPSPHRPLTAAAMQEQQRRPRSAGANVLDPAYRKMQADRLLTLAEAYVHSDAPAIPLEISTEALTPSAGQAADDASSLHFSAFSPGATPQRPAATPPSRPSSAPAGGRQRTTAKATTTQALPRPEIVTLHAQQPFKFAYNGAVEGRSESALSAATSAPGLVSPARPGSGSGSVRSPRQQFERKFTMSGRASPMGVDPTAEVLLDRYRIAASHTPTSSADYGLFAKDWSRSMRARQQVYRRQRAAHKELLAQTAK